MRRILCGASLDHNCFSNAHFAPQARLQALHGALTVAQNPILNHGRLVLLHTRPTGLTLASASKAQLAAEIAVDQLNKWFLEVSESPVGSIVLFALVFITRISLSEWARRRETRKAHKHARRKPA